MSNCPPEGQQNDYGVVYGPPDPVHDRWDSGNWFMRPIRRQVRHGICGREFTLDRHEAERLASMSADMDKNMLFCEACRKVYPCGDRGDFFWASTNEKVGA